MPKLATPLSALQIKAAKPTGAAQLTDGRGLYLKMVWPSGRHSWRFDFKSPATGKRNTLYLGTWPELTIAEARERAEDARRQIARNVCPLAVRDEATQARQVAQERTAALAQGKALPGTFRAVAEAFYAARYKPGQADNQWSATHAALWLSRMTRFIFPKIGAMMMDDVSMQQLAAAVLAVEGVQARLHVRVAVCSVYGYGVAMGLCKSNPAAALKTVSPNPPKSVAHPAPENIRDARDVMAKIDAFHIDAHRECLRFMAMVAQRPGNVLAMEWAELDLDGGRYDWAQHGLSVDFDGPVWVIPSAKMKRRPGDKMNGKPHAVPLPAAAVALLLARRAAVPADCPLVWPGKNFKTSGGTLTAEALHHSLHKMGLEGRIVPHGFRAMFRTLADQDLRQRQQPLEAQLAHSNGLATGMSYARSQYLQERAEIAELWVNYLRSPNVVPLALAA